MATITIVHTCGHSEAHPLIGPARGRAANRRRWTRQVCSACREVELDARAEGAVEAHYLAELSEDAEDSDDHRLSPDLAVDEEAYAQQHEDFISRL